MKKIHVLMAALVLGAILLQTPAVLADSTAKNPSAEQPSSPSYEGVWQGVSSTLLIVEVRNSHTVMLLGKDAASTWSATGILDGQSLICRGSGQTNAGVPFLYESTLTFGDDGKGPLKEKFTIHQAGEERSSKDEFTLVPTNLRGSK